MFKYLDRHYRKDLNKNKLLLLALLRIINAFVKDLSHSNGPAFIVKLINLANVP